MKSPYIDKHTNCRPIKYNNINNITVAFLNWMDRGHKKSPDGDRGFSRGAAGTAPGEDLKQII